MPIVSGGSGGTLPGVTVSGTPAASQVVVASSASAAAWAYPPGFEIGYDQITAPVNIASTTEATGTTIISAAAHTFDGGLVLAHFFAPYVENGTAAASTLHVSLFESTTQIGRMCSLVIATATLQLAAGLSGFLRFTPSAGSHTYTVTAFANNTTGTPQIGAGASGTGAWLPAFLRFTKV